MVSDSLRLFALLALGSASVHAQGTGQGGGQETAIPPPASFQQLIGSTGKSTFCFD